MTQVFPDVRAEHMRITQRRFNGEVFFERYFALHWVLPAFFASCNALTAFVSSRAYNKKAASVWAAYRAVASRRMVEPGGVEPPTS
jgi:hypothetical protein